VDKYSPVYLQNNAKAFWYAVGIMVIWMFSFWIMSKLHWGIPLLVTTTIGLTYGSIFHLVLMVAWLGGKIIMRIKSIVDEPQNQKLQSQQYHPAFYMQPVKPQERIKFTEIQPTVELIICMVAAGILIYLGRNDLQCYIGVLIMLVMVRAVPSAGGNSTATVILWLSMMIFVFMSMGPAYAKEWMDTISDFLKPVEPQREEVIRQVTYSIPHVLWEAYEAGSRKIFTSVGLVMDLSTVSGYVRSVMGYMFISYNLIDALKGPGKALAAMIFMQRTKDAELQKITIANTKSAYIAVFMFELMVQVSLKRVISVTSMLMGLMLGVLLWICIGDHPWKAIGFFSKSVVGRTDTQVPPFDAISEYRMMMARATAFVMISVMAFSSGFTGMVSFLLLGLALAYGNEKLLTMLIGLMTQSCSLIYLSISSNHPITGDLKKGTMPAADPTYAATGANSATISDS
jgi:hypothetical protein